LASFLKGGGQQVTKVFPYLKGGLLEKKIQLVKNYGLDRFQMALVCLLEVEIKAKNSSVDSKLLLEILIAKLTYIPPDPSAL